MTDFYSSHDAGGSGVGSIGDPFTLQELIDNVGTNDLGLIMNTGTYTPGATIDFDTNTGAPSTPIQIRGANADGTDDGTVVTISGASLPGGNTLISFNLSSMDIVLQNIIFTSGKLYDLIITSSGFTTFINCRFTDAASNGMYVTSSSGLSGTFIDCEFDNNTGRGFSTNADARGKMTAIRCSYHDNDSDGIRDSMPSAGTIEPSYTDCLIYSNGGHGMFMSAAATTGGLNLRGCVFFGNTNDGLNISTGVGMIVIENSIFRSNGGFGIDTNTGVVTSFIMTNNCSDNNTSGHIDINGGTLPGPDNILADPKFTNEGVGVEDFSLQSDSPCIATGVDAGIW